MIALRLWRAAFVQLTQMRRERPVESLSASG
jgi:hypothetical protein